MAGKQKEAPRLSSWIRKIERRKGAFTQKMPKRRSKGKRKKGEKEKQK